jgi:hypothetical protein
MERRVCLWVCKLFKPHHTPKYSRLTGFVRRLELTPIPQETILTLGRASFRTSHLDLEERTSQTRRMNNSFLVFDFGNNEEAAQLARHKLYGWRQAFRLDKKLQFKFDRADGPGDGAGSETDKPKGKGAAKGKDKAPGKAAEVPANSGNIRLLVRLYFSGHEKLSHQRWVDRIPGEEPFKSATPRMIKQDSSDFSATEEKFQNLE